MTSPGLFLWGMYKGKIYWNKPRTDDDLKENIQSDLPDTLDDIRKMELSLDMCLVENGDQFQHRLD